MPLLSMKFNCESSSVTSPDVAEASTAGLNSSTVDRSRSPTNRSVPGVSAGTTSRATEDPLCRIHAEDQQGHVVLERFQAFLEGLVHPPRDLLGAQPDAPGQEGAQGRAV